MRALFNPSSERPLDRFEAVSKPSSERPFDFLEALPSPRSTPTPAGGPPECPEPPPEPRPPPPPDPLPWPNAVAVRLSATMQKNAALAVFPRYFAVMRTSDFGRIFGIPSGQWRRGTEVYQKLSLRIAAIHDCNLNAMKAGACPFKLMSI